MIYVTGDTHGEFESFIDRNIQKKLKSKDMLIICGDFGFIWDASIEEEKILSKIGSFGFKVLFLDGNHENFDLLKKYKEESFAGGRVQHICGNLYRLMRGHIYNLDGHSIFVFGGGESLEKEARLQENKWWKEEMPTSEEISFAIKNLDSVNRKVDYILTHEPPGSIKNLIEKKVSNRLNFINTFFDSISKDVNFKTWFFGSLHTDKKFTSKYTAVFNKLIKIN
ncbi:MAG: metallophosphatase family protein [Oscillospiraceae bacterium]|nr:metallophosphatase family protein [Oscillospiraceae bacterium]